MNGDTSARPRGRRSDRAGRDHAHTTDERVLRVTFHIPTDATREQWQPLFARP